MCPALESLFTTLKRQDLDYLEILAPLVIEKARALRFDLRQMVDWAAGLIRAYGLKKDEERKSLDGLSLEYLSYVGLGSRPITNPKRLFSNEQSYMSHSRKRHAPNNLRG